MSEERQTTRCQYCEGRGWFTENEPYGHLVPKVACSVCGGAGAISGEQLSAYVAEREARKEANERRETWEKQKLEDFTVLVNSIYGEASRNKPIETMVREIHLLVVAMAERQFVISRAMYKDNCRKKTFPTLNVNE